MGPGIVTGAADDDPSGIATYTQAGAHFGTGVLWTVFLSIPFMIAGTREVTTAAQAAEALRPLAGDLAFALFAVGIMATGMLAVPVLASSAAYAVAEAFGWPEGLALMGHDLLT